MARQLEERWQAEAECEADAHAVRGDGHRAVVLAAALVKVARLGGVTAVPPIIPAWTSSAFHVPTLLEMRVRRLVSGSAPRPAAAGTAAVVRHSHQRGHRGRRMARWILGRAPSDH